MEITSYGACREVTGSAHLISCNESKVLLDCGLFQGKRKECEKKNRNFPFQPGSITNVLLSHAHIDHSGRIPMLTAQGFKGRIITTRPTQDACDYMLRDSAHIQESDANYLNYKTARSFLYEQTLSKTKKKKLRNSEIAKIKKLLKKDRWYVNKERIAEVIAQNNLPEVTPLYTMEDAENSLKQFEGYPLNDRIEIGNNVFCTFYNAGHILGSAITIVEIKIGENRFVVAYSGDIGRFDVPLIKNPVLEFPPEHRDIDILIMESTYGDRIHDPVYDLKEQLAKVIERTFARKGTVLIPSFAMERAQVLIYLLHELYNEGKLPSIPVYIDSPLAVNLTKVFGEHPECYDIETHSKFLENGKNPFVFEQLTYVNSVEESMELNRDESPHIVISGSGMCEGGRILHHMRYKIHDPKNTLLFVGYQAENTLGRRIIEKARAYRESGGDYPLVKFMNKEYPVKADVVQMEGFSAHADRNEILRFISGSNLKIKKIALVHGEQDAISELGKHLKERGYSYCVPDFGEPYNLT